MTDQTHPSLDDLADLQEGLLPPPRARDLAAHLSECDTCSTASAAVDDVTRVLSGAASDPIPMPDPVAASLDEALHRASRERAAVPSLSQYRAAPRPEAVRVRRSRWAAWVAGAAAAVAIGYAGVNLLDSTPSSDLSTADSGAVGETAPEREAVSSQPEAAGKDNTASDRPRTGDLRTLNRKTLPSFAGVFATGKVTRGSSLVRDCPSVDVSADDRATVVRWRGIRAVVVIDRSNRRATVYRCTGDADRLFATQY